MGKGSSFESPLPSRCKASSFTPSKRQRGPGKPLEVRTIFPFTGKESEAHSSNHLPKARSEPQHLPGIKNAFSTRKMKTQIPVYVYRFCIYK